MVPFRDKMLGVESVKFLALLLILGALVRTTTAYLLQRNPDSAAGKALAFIY